MIGDARAQVLIHVLQVIVDRALLNGALHPLAQLPDDVADQVVPLDRRHHLAVERTGFVPPISTVTRPWT